MRTTQITSFSFFEFQGLPAKFWALSQMGLAPRRLGTVPGLQFIKFLGSGAANGFSIKPNFSRYGMLAVWENEAAATHFLSTHTVPCAYRRRSSAYQHVLLRNTMAHGAWDGRMPFESASDFDPAAPLAVLTRATIKKRHLLRFWKDVPRVSADLGAQEGLRFAVGVGELPLLQQATFSLWNSGKQMMDYAYKGQEHHAMVRKTRELGWYKEELFARFVPYRVEGAGIF